MTEPLQTQTLESPSGVEGKPLRVTAGFLSGVSAEDPDPSNPNGGITPLRLPPGLAELQTSPDSPPPPTLHRPPGQRPKGKKGVKTEVLKAPLVARPPEPLSEEPSGPPVPEVPSSPSVPEVSSTTEDSSDLDPTAYLVLSPQDRVLLTDSHRVQRALQMLGSLVGMQLSRLTEVDKQYLIRATVDELQTACDDGRLADLERGLIYWSKGVWGRDRLVTLLQMVVGMEVLAKEVLPTFSGMME